MNLSTVFPKVLEQYIDRLSACKHVYELKITKEDYQTIKQYYASLPIKEILTFHPSIKKTVGFFVFICELVYWEYEDGFWELMAGIYGEIKPNIRTKIGDLLQNIANNRKLTWDNSLVGAHKYVSQIILNSGIPRTLFSELWDDLDVIYKANITDMELLEDYINEVTKSKKIKRYLKESGQAKVIIAHFMEYKRSADINVLDGTIFSARGLDELSSFISKKKEYLEKKIDIVHMLREFSDIQKKFNYISKTLWFDCAKKQNIFDKGYRDYIWRYCRINHFENLEEKKYRLKNTIFIEYMPGKYIIFGDITNIDNKIYQEGNLLKIFDENIKLNKISLKEYYMESIINILKEYSSPVALSEIPNINDYYSYSGDPEYPGFRGSTKVEPAKYDIQLLCNINPGCKKYKYLLLSQKGCLEISSKTLFLFALHYYIRNDLLIEVIKTANETDSLYLTPLPCGLRFPSMLKIMLYKFSELKRELTFSFARPIISFKFKFYDEIYKSAFYDALKELFDDIAEKVLKVIF